MTDARRRHNPPGEIVVSDLIFLSWSRLYRPCACHKLMSAIRFISAAQRVRRIHTTIAKSACLTSGYIGYAIGVAGQMIVE